MSDLMKHFPSVPGITSPRELKRPDGTLITQEDVVRDTIDLVLNGCEDITICAPVGTGKSIMGLWAALALTAELQTKAVYTSPLNALVDQMHNNFGGKYVKTLKGREHYECVAGASDCSVGYCIQRKCVKTMKSPRECRGCTEIGCDCHHCIYKSHVHSFKDARIGNTNFSIYMSGISDADIVIIDECDEVEGFVRMSYTVTIPETIASSNYADHMTRLEGIRDEHVVDLQMFDDGDIDLEPRQVIKHERQIQSIQNILSDYERRKSWAITKNKDSTVYQPIDVSRYLDEILCGKTVIRMSATPYKTDSSVLIEVDSTFPKENRPWAHIPIGKMGRQHRDGTYDKIALFLDKLNGKTVVHCHSYSIAWEIENSLRKIRCSKQVFLQSNSHFENYNRNNIVGHFKESRDANAIMLSVNLTRGVDFPEDEIKNNVIVKQPWANPTDELVQAKNSLLRTTRWQNAEIANTIMQAYGRLPRRPEKQSMCYILDVDFNDVGGRGVTKSWYANNKSLFYNWFTCAEISGVDNICHVCGRANSFVYRVKYPQYSGVVCHECNKELFKKYGDSADIARKEIPPEYICDDCKRE